MLLDDFYEHDTAAFAEDLFAQGTGWLYPPANPETWDPVASPLLAQFQRAGLERWDSDDEKVLELWPRGHLKTTLARIWLIKQVVYKKRKNIAVICATATNTASYRATIRAAFYGRTRFSAFHWLLPYHFPLSREIIVVDNDEMMEFSNGVRIHWRSMQGNNRGINIEGRPDLIILDDILPESARTSDAEREHITDIWLAAIRLLGEEGAIFRGFGTILHSNDIWAQISAGVQVGTTRRATDPRPDGQGLPGWTVTLLEAHDDEYDFVLWPERWDKEKLLDLYEEYVFFGREHLYTCEMRNDPSTAASKPFSHITQFEVYDSLTREDIAGLFRVISIDHAQGAGGDEFVIVETGETPTIEFEIGEGIKDYYSDLLVLDLFAASEIEQDQKLLRAYEFVSRRRPHKLVIERTSESGGFIDSFAKFLRKKGISIDIEQPKAVRAKNDRIVAWLQPRYKRGRVRHARRAEWRKPLERQLRSFDITKTNQADDKIDALAHCAENSRPALPRDRGANRPKGRLQAKIYDKMHNIKRLKDETETDGLNEGDDGYEDF